jgi:hypothetical protein
MRPRRLLLVSLSVIAIAVPATAAEPDGHWVEDRYGDTFGSPPGARADVDLTDAYYGSSGDRIVHVVKVAGNMPAPQRDDVEALLLIDIGGDGGNNNDYCDFYVGRSGDRAGVHRCGTGERVGSARVVARNGNGVRYSFSARAIGSPDYYDWAVSMRGDANGVRDEFDRLPNGLENFHRHTLR